MKAQQSDLQRSLCARHPGRLRLACVALCFALFSCGQEGASENASDRSSAPATTQSANVNMVQPFPEAARKQAMSLLNAVESDSGSAVKNGLFAMFAHAYDQPALALAYYRRAAKLDPGALDWPYLEGVLLSAEGDEEKAMIRLREALEIDPDYAPLRLRMAQLVAEEKSASVAQTEFEALVTQYPKFAQARWAYGQFAFDHENYAEAIEQLNYALDQVPHYAAAHYTLSAAYKAEGEADKSAAHRALFQKHKGYGPADRDGILLQMKSMNDTSQQAISQAATLSAAGEFPKAIVVFEELLKKEPGNAVAHINLIGLYGELGQYDKAEQHYNDGLLSAPDNANLHGNFGVLLLKKNDFAKAAEAFKRAISADPDYTKAYKYLGLSLQQLGQNEEARQNFQSAFEIDPLDDQAGYLLAKALSKEEKYGESIEVLEQISVVRRAASSTYLRELAGIYFLNGDTGSAVNALERARDVARSFGQSAVVAQVDDDIKRLAATGTTKP